MKNKASAYGLKEEHSVQFLDLLLDILDVLQF